MILILNGPNLNMLGLREPDIYGHKTLKCIETSCLNLCRELKSAVEFRQTNSEAQMIEWIHQARNRADGIIINAGAWTHTSIAILDALIAAEVPVIEVHISNIHRREVFRNKSYISSVALAVMVGFGSEGYMMAIGHFSRMFNQGSEVE
ncbi:3-dehydroquinate dehydratase [Buttiauxella sp. BIGb0552]|nr:3-dehydroquinate dehydratase [Buttiauxella sp. BIGb0552]